MVFEGAAVCRGGAGGGGGGSGAGPLSAAVAANHPRRGGGGGWPCRVGAGGGGGCSRDGIVNGREELRGCGLSIGMVGVRRSAERIDCEGGWGGVVVPGLLLR